MQYILYSLIQKFQHLTIYNIEHMIYSRICLRNDTFIWAMTFHWSTVGAEEIHTVGLWHKSLLASRGNKLDLAECPRQPELRRRTPVWGMIVKTTFSRSGLPWFLDHPGFPGSSCSSCFLLVVPRSSWSSQSVPGLADSPSPATFLIRCIAEFDDIGTVLVGDYVWNVFLIRSAVCPARFLILLPPGSITFLPFICCLLSCEILQ